MPSMESLTHKTAVVIIPPEDVWEPIQAIRQKHDSKVARWMPHITLLYPFLPRSRFDQATEKLLAACRSIKPFDVELARFDHFGHGKGHFTLWLAPEPAGPIRDLYAALCPVVYDGENDSGRPERFAPHLSVGQARGMGNMVKRLQELQSGWQPIRFQVASVQMIWRNDPPDDLFRVDRALPLRGEQLTRPIAPR